MKIAVVDDCGEDRNGLISYIKKVSHTQHLEIQIFEHSLGENFLEDEELSTLDVVFLDIYMGKENGMEIAKKLREREYSGFIVFCTTTPTYALEGYEVKAFDYIVKPYTYEKIEELLQEISKTILEEPLSILVKDGRKWYKIKLCDLLYVENDANYVRIHTKGGVHSTRMAFKEMEKRLSQYRYFIRCDRGIIVNLFNAKEIVNHSIVMNNGEKIPISRRNISFVNEQYSDLIFEEMEKNQHV